MTSWEPYPQAKMTVAQERAYAERRRATKAASRKASRSSATGKKKRIVRTAAGARRYKVPIGSEIGTARNAEAAKAQRDTESTNRYRSLVGGSSQAQAATLRKVHNGALQRLARVAYSFKSSDPNVVKLRISVANEMRRRGMNVNDYGGLGPKTKNPGPAGTWARDHAKRVAARKKKAKKAKKKKTPKVKVTYSAPTPARSGMSARVNDRRLIEMSIPQLRRAVRVFPRIAPDKRQAVARVLVRKALELGAPHFLGQSVIEAANLPDSARTKVVELAGRWKHGWIPLDGAALASKMKGGKGKPWWDGGTGKGTNKARVRDGKLTVAGGAGVPMRGSGSRRDAIERSRGSAHTSLEKKGGRAAAGGGRVTTQYGTGKATASDLRQGKAAGLAESKRAASFMDNEVTGGKYAAKARAAVPKKGRVPIGGDPGGSWPRNLSRTQLREQHQTARDTLNEHSPKADHKRVAVMERELKARGLKPKPKGELSQGQKRYRMDNPDYGTKYPQGTSAYEVAKGQGKVRQPTGTARERFRASVGSSRSGKKSRFTDSGGKTASEKQAMLDAARRNERDPSRPRRYAGGTNKAPETSKNKATGYEQTATERNRVASQSAAAKKAAEARKTNLNTSTSAAERQRLAQNSMNAEADRVIRKQGRDGARQILGELEARSAKSQETRDMIAALRKRLGKA